MVVLPQGIRGGVHVHRDRNGSCCCLRVPWELSEAQARSAIQSYSGNKKATLQKWSRGKFSSGGGSNGQIEALQLI
ncbi:hypothetical protein MC885_005430 [Smutsia gigantea]|nr:hypothetical protein MC885_005430 [Smutsia gigantea]